MDVFHQRKSPRKKDFDYSKSGWHFVTINTQNQRKLFGEIRNEQMTLSAAGNVAQICWENIPAFFRMCNLKRVSSCRNTYTVFYIFLKTT